MNLIQNGSIQVCLIIVGKKLLKIFFSEEQILKNMQTKYPDDYNFYLII